MDESFLPEGTTVDDYFRVQFFSRVITDGVTGIKWHGAVRCNEIYKDKILEREGGLDKEFSKDFWICPDVNKIEVHNNPSTFQQGNGVNFNLVINSCFDAKRIDEENGLSTYNSTYMNCQDSEQATYKKTIS